MSTLIRNGAVERFESSHSDVIAEVELMAQSEAHLHEVSERSPQASTPSFLSRLFTWDDDRDLAA